MTTIVQDRDFATHIASNALGEAISWIGDNMNPEEVFDVITLEDWAKRNGYVNERR